MENDIVVFWHEKGGKKSELFNYAELIDITINAPDLLVQPNSYTEDKSAHAIMVKK